MTQSFFRAYDIRGIYGKELTEEVAEKLGKAFGTFIGAGKTIGVGRDVRLSGDILSKRLIEGLLSVGCDVVDFGLTPSPVLYFAIPHRKLDGGVVVTASHLPPEWNGFKMCDKEGIVVSDGTGLENVKKIFFDTKVKASTRGTATKDGKILDDYIEFVVSKIPAVKKKLKVILDLANSVSSLVMPEILRRLGCEVYSIHEELDGRFPNRASEPNEESMQKLKAEVVRRNADLGIGFDGDADRVAFVDKRGRIIFSGNVTIPIFANLLLGKSRKGKVVFDVTCSSSVEDFVRALGGTPIIIRVGHSYCSTTVKKEKAVFGGQFSGHMCFPDTYYTDDAMFAAVKLIEAIDISGKDFSQLVDMVPTYFSTKMEEVPCEDGRKFEIIDSIKRKLSEKYKILDIDGVRVAMDGGWVLMRASNTGPMIRVIADAKKQKDAQRLHEFGSKLVREEIAKHGK